MSKIKFIRKLSKHFTLNRFTYKFPLQNFHLITFAKLAKRLPIMLPKPIRWKKQLIKIGITHNIHLTVSFPLTSFRENLLIHEIHTTQHKNLRCLSLLNQLNFPQTRILLALQNPAIPLNTPFPFSIPKTSNPFSFDHRKFFIKKTSLFTINPLKYRKGEVLSRF